MQRFILKLVVLSAIFFVFSPIKAQADHSWGGYHWARTTNPFTIKLGDNVNSKWDPHLVSADFDWTVSDVLNTDIVDGGTNNTKGRNTPKTCTPTLGRGEICNAKYGGTGWLGIASVWVSGMHITQGTVKLNDTYFNTGTYNKPAWRNLVMCQEIGHIFGLDHQDENFGNTPMGTCMDYSNDPLPNQHPNAHDYEMLETLYGHNDSLTTISQALTNAGQNIDHEDRRTWGRELRTSENKRHSVFERDFGNGNKAFTFVTWAE